MGRCVGVAEIAGIGQDSNEKEGGDFRGNVNIIGEPEVGENCGGCGGFCADDADVTGTLVGLVVVDDDEFFGSGDGGVNGFADSADGF